MPRQNPKNQHIFAGAVLLLVVIALAFSGKLPFLSDRFRFAVQTQTSSSVAAAWQSYVGIGQTYWEMGAMCFGGPSISSVGVGAADVVSSVGSNPPAYSYDIANNVRNNGTTVVPSGAKAIIEWTCNPSFSYTYSSVQSFWYRSNTCNGGGGYGGGATSVVITGPGMSTVTSPNLTGSLAVTPQTGTYTVSCQETGPYFSTPTFSLPVIASPIALSISANPTSVTSGQSSSISWSANQAEGFTCKITDPTGATFAQHTGGSVSPRVFSSPGSFSFALPSFARMVVSVFGAGGGGGGANGAGYTSTTCDSKGGCYSTDYAGGTGSPGTNGVGDSTFASLIAYPGTYGTNGTASGGDTNTPGGAANGGSGSPVGGYGGLAVKTYTNSSISGTASGFLGTGGTGGAGGAGAVGPSGNGASGGNGGNGIARFEYFMDWIGGPQTTGPLTSPTNTTKTYTLTCSAENSSTFSTSTTIAVISSAPPTLSITAGGGANGVAASTTVGIPIVIATQYTPASGDTLTATAINGPNVQTSVPGVGTGSPFSPKSYTFTPSAPGTYTFYPSAQTTNYPTWNNYSKSVTVTANCQAGYSNQGGTCVINACPDQYAVPPVCTSCQAGFSKVGGVCTSDVSAPVISFSASRAQKGSASTLSWTVTGMSTGMSCSIIPTPASGQIAWPGLSSTWTDSIRSQNLNVSTTFTMTCGKPGAMSSKSAVATVMTIIEI